MNFDDINSLAKEHDALINLGLTCILVISTITYVWISYSMLREMILSRRLSIAPRITFSIDSLKFTNNQPIMPVTFRNSGRGDAYSITLEAIMCYLEDGKLSRQSTKVSNPEVALKPGCGFDEILDFYFKDDYKVLANNKYDLCFETVLSYTDGDGHQFNHHQLYTIKSPCYDSERPLFALIKIYRIPFMLRMFYKITNQYTNDYWIHSR